MSKELEKMNIISIVQKLKEDDVIILQKYIENLEKENEKLNHYKTLYQSLKRQKDEAIEYIKLYISKEMVESTPGNNYELKELHLSDYKLSELLKILEGVDDVMIRGKEWTRRIL